MKIETLKGMNRHITHTKISNNCYSLFVDIEEKEKTLYIINDEVTTFANIDDPFFL